MTITARAYEGIRITAGSEVKPYEGKPRFRSTAQATGFVPFVDLRKASEAAAMSMRCKIFSRRVE